MPEITVAEILMLEPKNLQKWVQSALTREFDVDANFNWLGLAEVLAFNAREGNDVSERILFAGLAVTIYDWLAKTEDPEHSDSYIDSAIAVRVYMLSNNYVDSFHPILGINRIKRPWEGAKFSPSEALEIAESFRDKLKIGSSQISLPEREKIRELRRIKNKMSLINQLPADSDLLKEAKSNGWLEVYSRLP